MSAQRVLIAGVSTRAAAESAARAGFDVTAIDAFADVDQHPAVRALALPGSFTARAAAEAARSVDCDAVAYLSNFENHPDAVRTLRANRMLWGNPPEILTRVRDPIAVAHGLALRGLATPESQAMNGEPRRWLLKPIASGGGHGIRLWRRGDAVPRGTYLQAFVEGAPGSVVFAAAAGRAVPLGVCQQLIGDRAFGADGFRYCGNILAPSGDIVFGHDDDLVAAACELAEAVADEFGLVGVNGIDFVARDAIPSLVEINPRWCGSMELVERAYGRSVFGAHAAACQHGALPDFDLPHARRAARAAFGKAVVFAHREVAVGDTRTWSTDTAGNALAYVRDVPRASTHIRTGRPICTVFAEASTAAACYSALVARAERVYAALAAVL